MGSSLWLEISYLLLPDAKNVGSRLPLQLICTYLVSLNSKFCLVFGFYIYW
jgi:hypothetical protein